MRDRFNIVVCAAGFVTLSGLASCADDPVAVENGSGGGGNAAAGSAGQSGGSVSVAGSSAGGSSGAAGAAGAAGLGKGGSGNSSGAGGTLSGASGSGGGASGSAGSANGGQGGSSAGNGGSSAGSGGMSGNTSGTSGSGGSAGGSENGGTGSSAGEAGSTGKAGGAGFGGGSEGGAGGADDGNLLQGSGFETGTTEGWVPRGSATIAVTTEYAHTGSHSLKVTNRAAVWHGTEYDALSLAVPGTTYQAAAWVRVLDGSSPTTLILTRQIRPNSGGCPLNEFSWIANMGGVSPGTWIELAGAFTVPAGCDPTLLTIYVEASDPTVGFYVDDVYLGVN